METVLIFKSYIDFLLLKQQQKCPPGEHPHVRSDGGQPDCHPKDLWHKNSKYRHEIKPQKAPQPAAQATREDMQPLRQGKKYTPSGVLIPPAWTDVQVAKSKNASLQAIGKDAKGRTQYLYSTKHSQKAAEAKFRRTKKFGAALPRMRKKILAGVKAGNEAAEILYLVDKTAFRIGGRGETMAAKKAYGASTLLGQHVNVQGNTVSFSFIGKKGVQIDKTVEDPLLARIIKKRKTRPDAPLFSASSGKVNDYLQKEVAPGGDFSVKDFRTWHGSDLALKELQSMQIPSDKKGFIEARKAIATKVSQSLGNTPSVALANYIAPFVWAPWHAVALQQGVDLFAKQQMSLYDLMERVHYDEIDQEQHDFGFDDELDYEDA